MHDYNLNEEEILKKVDSSLNGLTEKEALKRLSKDGENKLKGQRKNQICLNF